MAGLGRMLAGIAGAALLAARAGLRRPAPSRRRRRSAGAQVSGVTVTAPEKPNPLVNPESQFVRGHLPQNRNQHTPASATRSA